jgi:hypothetical protein
MIVKHKDHLGEDGGDLVKQRGQHRLNRWRMKLRSVKRGQRALPNTAFSGLQRCNQVCQKTGRVVVPFVQRELGDRNGPGRSAHRSDPFAQQRGLAKAGRSGDERQSVARTVPLVQLLDQAGTWHDAFAGPDGRDIELVVRSGFDTGATEILPILETTERPTLQSYGQPEGCLRVTWRSRIHTPMRIGMAGRTYSVWA